MTDYSVNLSDEIGARSNWTEGDEDYWEAEQPSVGNWAGYDSANACLLFRWLPLIPGSTVSSASLTLVAAYNCPDETVRLRIRAIDADDATLPESYAEAESVARTTAYVDWTPGPWTQYASYETPDLSAIVQELADRPGWRGTIAFLIEDNGSDYGATRDFYTLTASYATLLEVTYTSDRTLLTLSVSGDGYWDDQDESLISDYTRSYFGAYSSGTYHYGSFLRIEDLDAQQDHTIDAAYLRLWSDYPWTGYVKARITAQAADNAAAPTSYADFSAARTTAYATWEPGDWEGGTRYETPDLSAIIQEVITRPGWIPGNAIVLYIEDDGSDEMKGFYTAEAKPAYVETLTLILSEPAVPSYQYASDTLTTTETILVDKHLALSDTLTSWDDEPVRKETEDSLSTAESLEWLRGIPLTDTLATSESVKVDKQLVVTDTFLGTDSPLVDYGDITHVQNHPHLSRWYMAVKVPRIICWYGVTESRQDEEDNTISVGSVNWVPPFDAFDVSAFLEDATLWVGDVERPTKHGKARLRSVGEGELTVGADMHCDWQAGDAVCVMDVWELWPKLHKAEAEDETFTVWKDTDLEASARAEYPVPVFGPPACVFLSDGSASVVFDGTSSYKVQPNSDEYADLGWGARGISTWEWTLEGATVTNPTGSHVVAEYTVPGQYLAFLKVTDVDGLTSWGVRNVFVYDDELDPVGETAVLPETHFSLQRLSGSLDEHGWQGEVEVFGDLFDPDHLVNGAQVVLFADEWFGGVRKDFGLGHLYLTGRNNIKMVGWIADSSIGYDGHREARMKIRGLQQYLKSATNYATYFTQADDDAADWLYFPCPTDGLTVRKYLYHSVQWHYTLMRFTDYLIPEDHNNYLAGHEMPEGSLDVQLDSFVRRVQGDWCADKGGCLHVFSKPNYLPVTGDGAGWRTRLYHENTLSESDFSRLDVLPRLRDTVARVRVEGIVAFSTGAYQTSIDTAPGDVRNYGGANIVVGQQIVGTGGFEGSQGWELARMVHAEESRGIEEITLKMLGNYSHFDIVPDMAWTQVTASLPTLRGVSWAQKPFWVTGMRIEVDHEKGDTQTTLTLFPETKMSLSIRSYGQYDEVGLEPQEEGTSGAYALTDAIVGDEDTVEIPALLGDGAGHVEGPSIGTALARLWGDPRQLVVVENRNLKPVDDRTVIVTRTKGTRYSGKPGQSIYTAKEPRQNWGEEGGEHEDRSYTWHRGVLTISGTLRVGTGVASYALPVTGQEVKLFSLDAYLKTAPTGGPAVIQLTSNGSVVASVTVGAGSKKGTYTLPTPVDLDIGAILDLNVTLVGTTVKGSNLTLTAVCREYGI